MKKIRILGIGCEKEAKIHQNLNAALVDLNCNYPVEIIRDINEILEYRIAGVPALFINKRLVTEGKIVSKETIKQFL